MTRSDEFKQGYINCIADYKTYGIKHCRKNLRKMEEEAENEMENETIDGYEDAFLSLNKDKIALYTKRRTASYL